MKLRKIKPTTVVIIEFIMLHVIHNIILRVVSRTHKRFVRGMYQNILLCCVGMYIVLFIILCVARGTKKLKQIKGYTQ